MPIPAGTIPGAGGIPKMPADAPAIGEALVVLATSPLELHYAKAVDETANYNFTGDFALNDLYLLSDGSVLTFMASDFSLRDARVRQLYINTFDGGDVILSEDLNRVAMRFKSGTTWYAIQTDQVESEPGTTLTLVHVTAGFNNSNKIIIGENSITIGVSGTTIIPATTATTPTGDGTDIGSTTKKYRNAYFAGNLGAAAHQVNVGYFKDCIVTNAVHFGTSASNRHLPGGASPSYTINLANAAGSGNGLSNHQKLNLTSCSGTLALSLDAPDGDTAGVITIKQHATTPVDIVITAAGTHNLKWYSGLPDFAGSAVGAKWKLSWSYDSQDDEIGLMSTEEA